MLELAFINIVIHFALSRYLSCFPSERWLIRRTVRCAFEMHFLKEAQGKMLLYYHTGHLDILLHATGLCPLSKMFFATRSFCTTCIAVDSWRYRHNKSNRAANVPVTDLYATTTMFFYFKVHSQAKIWCANEYSLKYSCLVLHITIPIIYVLLLATYTLEHHHLTFLIAHPVPVRNSVRLHVHALSYSMSFRVSFFSPAVSMNDFKKLKGNWWIEQKVRIQGHGGTAQ